MLLYLRTLLGEAIVGLERRNHETKKLHYVQQNNQKTQSAVILRITAGCIFATETTGSAGGGTP